MAIGAQADQWCERSFSVGVAWSKFISAGLFVVGAVVLFTGVSSGSQGAIVFWLINSLVFLASLFFAYGDVKVRQERVEAQRDAAWRVIMKSFADVMDDRRRAAREYEPPGPNGGGTTSAPMPAPGPQLYGVDPRGAEEIVAAWMRHLGASDAETTTYTGDGGVDVTSLHYIAQVKHYVGTVGVGEVRELAGVAHVDGRHPLFFTSGQYAQGAVEFADRAGIALLIYDVQEGEIVGANELGVRAVTHGL